jgi:hypothetical protein
MNLTAQRENSIIASMSIVRWLKIALILILGLAPLAFSSLPPGKQLERVRAFTRNLEFDYITWTLNALWVKLGQSALGIDDYLSPQTQHQVVLEYLDLVNHLYQTEDQLNAIYADPDVPDPERASQPVMERLTSLQAHRAELAPLAESVLQDQIAITVAGLGLSFGGQALPPVLYHSTPLPTALIVSPRDIIQQDYNISLTPDLSVDQRAALEESVDRALDVSSLVVDVGGIGMYPTMVIQTSDLVYLSEVIAHEWTHNFLTLRPLGLNYFSSPELRTMNETAASIAGIEIGRALMERYYPDLLPPPPSEDLEEPQHELSPPPEPVFDFREEMRQTRVTVDQLLAEGEIEAAEAYMEARRQVFLENGYRIRKLNQAYFAFHGAYGELPGGAAGEDPVGAAVRALRAQSPYLAAFLKIIAWMTSFEQLESRVNPAD